MKSRFLKKTMLFAGTMGASAFLISSTGSRLPDGTPWVAPASADAVKNPLSGNAEATAAGKKTYTIYCVACHGEKGKGDGLAAAGLNPKPADHSNAKFQGQTDGVIYWKLTTGRAPMAGYAKMLTDDQRWQLVNYMRTLKKH